MRGEKGKEGNKRRSNVREVDSYERKRGKKARRRGRAKGG